MAEVTFEMSPKGVAFIHARAAVVRRKVTRMVGRDARRYVPVDTGALRGSITVDPDAGEVSVGTDYWSAQEYGAEEHLIGNAFGRGEDFIVVHPGNAAQPFMRPALYTFRTDLS
jgi:hypothetical protein